MKLDDYIEKLKEALPGKLECVALYGSAASGEFIEKRSDYNLLVVTHSLGLPELDQLTGPTQKWLKAGNPPPYCFTLDRLKASVDVFPIELLDIKDQHRILFGRDVLTELNIITDNLRHQLEFELKSKLIQLREHYLLTAGNPNAITDLLIDSLSSFLVLFRAALRLYETTIPSSKFDALRSLSRHLKLPLDPFETIHSLKTGAHKEPKPKELFQNYLTAIETVVDSVDQHLHSPNP